MTDAEHKPDLPNPALSHPLLDALTPEVARSLLHLLRIGAGCGRGEINILDINGVWRAAFADGDGKLPASGGVHCQALAAQRAPSLCFTPPSSSGGAARFYAGAKIVRDGELIGSVCVLDTQMHDCDALLTAELEAATAHVGELMTRHFQSHGNTDALTGLSNRRGFDDALQAVRARLERYRDDFACLRLNADNLAEFNDEFGRAAGDQVLRQLGEAIQRAVRIEDYAARVGGDEFAVLLPNTDLDGAQRFTKRLRAITDGIQWAHRPVTMSIGVAHSADFEDAEDAVAAAGSALSRAKLDGKDRIAVVG